MKDADIIISLDIEEMQAIKAGGGQWLLKRKHIPYVYIVTNSQYKQYKKGMRVKIDNSKFIQTRYVDNKGNILL